MASRTLFNGERNLTSIGFLNFTNQECVIHYGKLPKLVAVQQTINICVENTLFEGRALFQTVTEQLNLARDENAYVREAVEVCNQSYSESYQLTDCVNRNVSLFLTS